MDGDKLKAEIKVATKRFYNEENHFGIITFTIKKFLDGNVAKPANGRLVAKGLMPPVTPGCRYTIEAKEVDDPNWGIQYNVDRMYSSLLLNENDAGGQREYLESLFTENQVEALYDCLDNPYKVLKEKDVQALVQVKGCGFKTANAWITKFHRDLDKSRLYAELSEYNFTSTMIGKLLKEYRTPDIVIDVVKNRPYSLIDVSGIGWKKCDSIAQKGGLNPHCPERVEAFLKHYLMEQAENGYTYVYANEQLMPSLLSTLGEDIPDEPILAALKNMNDKLWWDDDRTVVGLRRYVELENSIAKKLIDLRDAPNNFKYDGWEEIIRKQEEKQGWCYTDQQIQGIKATLENQVVIITGAAGCGKSSIVAGMVEVLKEYGFVQCALSGRAAARLTEVTGVAGYTIHRLLGYPNKTDPDHPYFYHSENFLPSRIVIVDEVSMIGGNLFWRLVQALEPGTKLIMLGDVGQLESIGSCNLINDMIASPEIKSVVLDKIHRQAAASAIITESMSARKGIQTLPKDYTGIETKGELQDLTYDCYSDAPNTFFKVLEYASKLKEKDVSLEDMQVIVPIKDKQSGTYDLNIALQEIFNPLNDREEIVVSYEDGLTLPIRVGDKVINTKNNYGAKTYAGQWECRTKEDAKNLGEQCPIFNGNMGIVKAINPKRGEIIVDFYGIGTVLIERDKLSSVMLGYAVTVHKCQGSEFKYIIFGLDFSSYSLLSRQMVYTAITRAKTHCYVIAQTKAYRYAISQNAVSKKQTLLQDMLHQIAHPKMIF